MNTIFELARPGIQTLTPYSSARHEAKKFSGSDLRYLDANELFCSSKKSLGINRYPDPLCQELKSGYLDYLGGAATGLTVDNLFVGLGSDEAISLLINTFCEAGKDNIAITPPTYGMYKVSADILGVSVGEARLKDNFLLDWNELNRAINNDTKIVFICSPNNPTGNAFNPGEVLRIFDNPKFRGLLVVDEAYQEFSTQRSFVEEVPNFERLVVLRTFSKAFGIAGARVGLAVANAQTVRLLNSVKPPYNVPTPSQELALAALSDVEFTWRCRDEILRNKMWLAEQLGGLSGVTVFPSEANFLLVKLPDANATYKELVKRGIVVRNRSSDSGCQNCIRITIGDESDVRAVYDALRSILERNI